MFLGHYATAVAVKAADRRLPLGALFIAVQLLDVAWAALITAGVEKVRIVPGFTESNPLDLYYYPYSHSLAAAGAWALGAGLLWMITRRPGPALLVGLAVFTHWPLDWLVHTPDLPLYDDAGKVGLGLWNHFAVAVAIEIAMYVLATVYYFRVTRAQTPTGRWLVPVIGALLLGVQLSQKISPPPPSIAAMGATILGGFLLFAGLAHWADRKRI
jgi:hypothetical protein